MRVGYYFGAGISQNAIPMYNGFNDRIQFLANNLKHFKLAEYVNKHRPAKVKHYSDLLQEMCNLWIQIIDKCEGVSLDVLAEENRYNSILNKVKLLLSTYFMIEQKKQFPFSSIMLAGDQPLYGYAIDPRIRQFLCGLNDSALKFRHNPVILTWNYDWQFEMAMLKRNSDEHDRSHLSDAYRYFNIFPRPNEDMLDFDKLPDHILVKLNGTAGFTQPLKGYDDASTGFRDFNETSFGENLLQVLDFYHNHTQKLDKGKTLLYFAFENNQYQNKYDKILKRYLEDVEVLYIMGYSFPPQNERVDKKMLNNMPALRKVIIHDISEKSVEIVKSLINKSGVIMEYEEDVNSIPIYRGA